MRLFLLLAALITIPCYSQTNHIKNNTSEILSEIDYNIIMDNRIVDNIPFEILNIGNLKVSSGKIVAFDPLFGPFNIKPYTINVPPGDYPVKIYIAQTHDFGDRYALTKLEFSDRKAVKWILALTEDDATINFKDGDYTGFPVETGLGAFSDYEAYKEYKKYLIKFLEQNPDKNIYNDLMSYEFLKNADKTNPNDIGDWVNYYIPDSKHNITMFHSGYGDGLYPSYWGIDKNGEIVSLVIDFLVFQH